MTAPPAKIALARRIRLEDFRIPVSIGIHDFEKEGPQTVVVNVDLLLGPDEKAHNDRIANVLNYDTVHDGIAQQRIALHLVVVVADHAAEVERRT